MNDKNIKMKDLSDKRKELKKTQWIKNVIRIQGLTEEDAKALYQKIYETPS